MLNYTPSNFAAGEAPTAAKMNAQITTPFTDLQAPWTSWTPVLTATTTNPSVGAGTLEGWYTRIGKLVFFEWIITIGAGNTNGSGGWLVSPPVAPARSTNRQIFDGSLFDTSAPASYNLQATYTTTAPGLFALRQPGATTTAPLASFTGTSLVTIASGDVLELAGFYEAA